MESPSFCGSSKRAKAPGNISQIAHCLVDGCNADLSLCRDYHRRHKVCEIHSKTPKVTIGGREQRFCQQCSRFHSLVEFDEGKRSCRKRLEGHNRRRRKPQPDSFARNPALIFPSPPGPTLLSFTTPHIPQTSIVGPSWASRAVKPEPEPMLFNNHHHLNNYIDRPNSFPKNQLQFIQQEAAPCQPVESDRALSLLSSISSSVTRDPQAHQFHNLQYSGLGGEYVAVSAAPASRGSEASALHFPEMFQQGNEGSSTNGSHETLTFMWE